MEKGNNIAEAVYGSLLTMYRKALFAGSGNPLPVDETAIVN